MSQTAILETPLKITEEEVYKIKNRSAKYKEADISCVRAIAQAAINVELFTIPLYMTALYSIQGTHQITSQDSDLYKGRWWPGMGPTAGIVGSNDTEILKEIGLTPNEKVFNKVYSIFIEEMLHLQLASNMANKIGVTPSFTSGALQTDTYGWKCYDNKGGIPHILNFKDCKKDLTDVNERLQAYFSAHYEGESLKDMRVKLEAMNPVQTLLFMIIEETEENAHKIIEKEHWYKPSDEDDSNVGKKYFENAPFDWWKVSNTEEDLPLFGSIGHMYLCYWSYLEIEYDDGTSLLDILLSDVQRDRFNNVKDNKQYPGIAGEIVAKVDLKDLKLKLINNINAITDQGEGEGVVKNITSLFKNELWVQDFLNAMTSDSNKVDVEFQPSVTSLNELYPRYNDEGVLEPDSMSGNAYARISNKEKDHFEIFCECMELITHYQDKDKNSKERYVTWDTWHKENPTKPWTKEMLNPKNTGSDYPALPKAEDVANALNILGAKENRDSTSIDFSQSAVGTLKGLTTVLNKYWNGETDEFPDPAMGGSGDRVSICWASTGEVPNLVEGIKPPEAGRLYNACQGMDYANPKLAKPEVMPDVTTYHSCKGSNDCRAQGGCGFVQSDKGGGSCSTPAAAGKTAQQREIGAETGCCSHAKQISKDAAGCGLPDIKSAPSDNKCGGFGGCAVPISASQLFPKQKECTPMMTLYEFKKSGGAYESKSIDTLLQYEKGDSVYETAWKAYCFATKQEKKLQDVKTEQVGDETIVVSANVSKAIRDPKNIDDIRLALPPST